MRAPTHRIAAAGTGLLILLSGCATGGQADAPETTSSTVATTTEQESRSASTDPTTTSTVTEPTVDGPTAVTEPTIEGPAAPDFELLLADGSTFSLSAEPKPVYLVFWAEW